MRVHLWAAIPVLLAACSLQPVSTRQPPAPQVVWAALTPSAWPVEDGLQQCAGQIPEMALFVEQVPASHLQESSAEVMIRLGEPNVNNGFAGPIAKEEIVVVVHPSNPVDSLSTGEIRALFSGKMQTWSRAGGAVKPVEIWVLPQSDEVRQTFDQVIMEGAPIASQAFIAADAATMLEAIEDQPAAIGYLPRAWLAGEVRAVNIDPPPSKDMSLPLLALLSEEDPQGLLRDLLYCLQQGPGQTTVLERYSVWD